jgi:hypothetical protein
MVLLCGKERTMFDLLSTHQATVLATIKATEDGLDANDAPDLMVVARARWGLARELAAYKHYKHTIIFDPLIEIGINEVRCQVIAMKEACLAADEAYRLYIAHWGAERFPECWEEYRPAARTMMTRARKHIELERKQLSKLVVELTRDSAGPKSIRY